MAKTLIGTVSSDKQDKTISVKVVTHKRHPVYKKSYIASKKFAAHDEKNEAKVGDKVSIVETTPMSKSKRHKLDKVLEKAILTEKDTAGVGEVEAKMKAEEKVKAEAKTKTKTTVKKEDK